MKKRNDVSGDSYTGAKSILEAYFQGELPEELKDDIFRWFLEFGHLKEVDDALIELYLNRIKRSPIPDSETIRNYNELIRKLDFPLSSQIIENQTNISSRPRGRAAVFALKVAAVVLPMLMIASYLLWRPASVDNNFDNERLMAQNSVEVSQTGQKRVVLPDSSEVWIQAGSKLDYPEQFGDKRVVFLEGEAFFSVTSDAQRPFKVVTNSMVIEVLGTEFNVVAYPDSKVAEVMLAKGSVEVTTGKNKKTKLVPNEKLTLDTELSEVNISLVEEKEAVPQWRVSDLNFENRRLDEILSTAGIYFGKEMRFDPGLKLDEHFTFQFRKQITLEDMLGIMKDLSGEFDYTLINDTIVISPL